MTGAGGEATPPGGGDADARPPEGSVEREVLPTVSVVVVSRHRNLELLRCLKGLSQLDHPQFEVVVIADPATAGGLAPRAAEMKVEAFDEANISAARNRGLALAAGQVVAFLDDDAVPEPSWLGRLIAPFVDPSVGYAGGFVRSFNGISYQWRAQSIDRTGRDAPVAVDPSRTSLHSGDGACAMTPLGANCAFRRDAALAVGGFDPALHYYRDESDLALRLAAAGWRMAVVPGAQVHHGRAQSARRTAGRAPISLFDIGASSAVFLRRHAGTEEIAPALDRLRAEQQVKLRELALAGRIKPKQRRRLLVTLEHGIAEGRERPLPQLRAMKADPAPFLAFPGTGPRPGLILSGRVWSRAAMRRAARRAVANGAIVTAFRFSPTALYHRMRFHPEGYWEQTGGLFGRSTRDAPVFAIHSMRARVAAEIARIAPYRPVDGG